MLFEMSIFLQLFKKQCSEILEMSMFSKLVLLTNLQYLTNILICFLLEKFISKIHEYLQKSENLIQVCEYLLFLATHAIWQTHLRLKYLKTKAH